jgi:hypothetical protein
MKPPQRAARFDKRAAAIAAIGAASLWACLPSLDDPERFQTSCPDGFSVEAMFRDRCSRAGCHASGPGAAAGLDLTSAGAFERMYEVKSAACNAPLISADGPDQSLLLQKLDGTSTCGARMPLGEDPLPESEIACVRAWIAEGLKNAPIDAGGGG